MGRAERNPKPPLRLISKPLLAFSEHSLAAQELTSSTAMQAERFACLYTSHVANLALYSPYKCYRGRMDSLAHEEEPVFGGGLPSSLDP